MNNKKCLHCKILTNNPKFCSRGCSVSYNNSIRPKRKWVCIKCGTNDNRLKNKGRKCAICKTPKLFLFTTLGEIRQRKASQGSPRYNWHNAIRWRARKIMLESGKNTCYICGYSKHVEAAHRRSIKDFPDSATIEEINGIENIIPLCPNCHWEFDHNLIAL